MLEDIQNNMKNNLWEEGSFFEPMPKEEADKKMRTFHMKHDEEMNFNCKKCKKKISSHNKDWHEGMCDDCFDETYFKEKRKKGK